MAQSPEYRRLVRLAGSFNRKAGHTSVVTADTLLSIENEETECHYCGIGMEIGQGTFDHVIPFARGGNNERANIVRVCLTCNRRKFTKTPGEFRASQALMQECNVCGKIFRPRWADFKRGYGKVCSRKCSGSMRWK